MRKGKGKVKEGCWHSIGWRYSKRKGVEGQQEEIISRKVNRGGGMSNSQNRFRNFSARRCLRLVAW